MITEAEAKNRLLCGYEFFKLLVESGDLKIIAKKDGIKFFDEKDVEMIINRSVLIKSRANMNKVEIRSPRQL